MDYKVFVSEKISVTDNVQTVLQKAKSYYKKRPWVLIVNLLLIIGGIFISPIISVFISLIAIFVLPAWREKIK